MLQELARDEVKFIKRKFPASEKKASAQATMFCIFMVFENSHNIFEYFYLGIFISALSRQTRNIPTLLYTNARHNDNFY